jgi:hypothetical protein
VINYAWRVNAVRDFDLKIKSNANAFEYSKIDFYLYVFWMAEFYKNTRKSLNARIV